MNTLRFVRAVSVMLYVITDRFSKELIYLKDHLSSGSGSGVIRIVHVVMHWNTADLN